MAVTFSLPTVLARLADGQATIKATGETLGDVVAEIAGRFPRLAPRLRDEAGGPYPFVTYYLNDEDIRFRNGFATPVSPGDEITVVAAIAGGRRRLPPPPSTAQSKSWPTPRAPAARVAADAIGPG
jgi:sulfur-carrier protein